MTDWVAKDMMLSVPYVISTVHGKLIVLETFCVIRSRGVHADTLPACYVSCVRGSTLLPSWTRLIYTLSRL